MRAREIAVDNFAGGGGASLGMLWALGAPPAVAVNHDPEAVAMHLANHPETRHYCEDVWTVDPIEATRGRPVGLAWFSPDCKHFSRAKGGRPVDKKIRGLAWVVVRWAKAVRPRVIMLENVEEFETWGPLKDDAPDPARRGLTFRRWLGTLRNLGYEIDWRLLRASDYGAPTTRRRLFLIARCDGLPIRWPEPTNDGPSASSIIDWGVECPSIFARKRPLADNTLRRLAAGIQRFVIESERPFVVEVPGEATDRREYVAAFLAKHYTGVVGTALDAPIGTVTARDHHSLVTARLGQGGRQVRAFLTKYFGQGTGQDVLEPLHTITSKARFGLVTVDGVDHDIVDVGMRMLTPRELYRAQGFPDSYEIEPEYRGKVLTKTAQIKMAGNSVCPHVAAALICANKV